MFNLPQEIKNIFEVFKKNGFEIYLVGDAVRDFLLGKTPTNFDFTTNALPPQFKNFFPNHFTTTIMALFQFL